MHYLKSGATYYAMKEAWEEEEMESRYSERGGGRGYRGASYARSRAPMMGRDMSREMGNGGYSGYYSPMDYGDPYWNRRY